MTLTEMLAKRDKLNTDYVTAKADHESIFEREKARHDKRMAALRIKAIPAVEKEVEAKAALDLFNGTTFGEMVIDRTYKEWSAHVYRANTGREWYHNLAWFRVMSDGTDCWWTLDIRYDSIRKLTSSRTKLGPGRLPLDLMPTSYREEGKGFMDHFEKVRELIAAAGIVLIEED